MATTIVTKNSATAGSAPSAGALSQGELAVNVADKRLFTKDSGGSVVEVGTNPGGAVTFTAGSASAPAITTTGDTNTGIFFPAADTIAFAEGGAEAMRLDSSGNLGLGVTPSAWASQYKAFQFGNLGGGALSQDNTNGFTHFTQNTTYTGNNTAVYQGGGYATRYTQAGGGHFWFTAPIGTTGNAVSWTQAMTLDADGRLGVGSTSPTTSLTVSGSGYLRGALNIIRTDTSSNFGFTGAASGGLQIYDRNQSDATRLVIDSDGNLLVGRTTALGGISFQNASETSMYRPTTNASQSITSFWSDVGGTQTVRAYIKVDGGLANYSSNNVNLSDRREKTNFEPSEDYLAKICAIPVQTFNYINEETDGKTLGVVAQDVQAVAPELITESNWGTEEEPKMRLSIYQTDLQYALMKAIQELKAEVDSLKAQLASQ
jgi:hypothetical protein